MSRKCRAMSAMNCFGVLKGKIQLLIANAGPCPYAELREQLLNS